MTNTPPEVLEKWRKDYLDYLDSRPSSMNDICAADLEAAFIAGRQTAVIELPDFQKSYSMDSYWPGYNDGLRTAANAIEDQGYRVEVNGDL
jgi:hypothetical protein